MRLVCIGDVAIVDEFPPWLPPGGIKPGEESKIIFNCELPLWTEYNLEPRTSGPRLISNPNLVKTIEGWAPGYTALANNHIMDGGNQGLAHTLHALSSAGFETTGAGFTEEEIRKPLIWETSDGKVAILNWVFPETHPDPGTVPGPSCWPGLENAKEIIQKLKNDGCWIVALTHWSDELFPYPRPEDRKIAKELIHAGTDILIGHHPHVVRGMERINRKPIFYSLGNYYFSEIHDQHGGLIFRPAPRNREAFGVKLTFTQESPPTFEIFSYWQHSDQTKPDPFQRAARRMRYTSKPLLKHVDENYSQWYQNRRKFFDRWQYRLIFAPWQKDGRGFLQYPFTLLSRHFMKRE